MTTSELSKLSRSASFLVCVCLLTRESKIINNVALSLSLYLLQLEEMEEERESLREEVETREKEDRHWSSELAQLTVELQLSREKSSQLEREGAELRAELARLTLLLEHTQREVGVNIL